MSDHLAAVSTLLVAPPGATTEALRATLQSIREVEIIDTVAGCLSASQAIHSLSPDVVVISGQIPAEEILALIGQPERSRQAPRVLILSASHAQAQRFLDAGAFAVVTPWEPVDRMRALIGRGTAKQTAANVTESGPAPSSQQQRGRRNGS